MQIQQSWEYAAKILCEAQLDLKELHGILALQKLWETNKAWMMPYLGPDGRISVELPGSFNEDDLESAIREAYRIATKLAQKPRYAPVLMADVGAAAMGFFETFLRDRLTAVEVVENKLSEKRPDPGRPGKDMPKGTKVSKYIAQVIQFDPSLAQEGALLSVYGRANAALLIDFINDVYSQLMSVIRRDTDYVVFSINPVDMILASSHTENWRSCHNIYNGECRTGPLSYLCDGVSGIGYAYRRIDNVCAQSADRKREYDLGFVWPRKLWRQMVFLDKDRLGAWFSREYPSQIAAYARAERGLAAQILSKYGNVDYKWRVKAFATGYRSDHDDEPGNGSDDACLESNNYHYKDSPTSAIRMYPSGRYPRVKPGVVRLPCLGCGTERNDNDRSRLICKSCDPRNHCASCNASIDHRSDSIHRDNRGRFYCPSCWSQLFCRCNVCHTWEAKSELTTVHGGVAVCRGCLTQHYSRCAHCDEYFESGKMTVVSDHGLFCENCVRTYAFKCDSCKRYYVNSVKYLSTVDGYTFCQNCHPEVHACALCGEKFRYPYSMIDGLCGKCANEQAAKELSQTEELISA